MMLLGIKEKKRGNDYLFLCVDLKKTNKIKWQGVYIWSKKIWA